MNGTAAKWVAGIVATLIVSLATFLFAHTQAPAHGVTEARLESQQQDLEQLRAAVETATEKRDDILEQLTEIKIQLSAIRTQIDERLPPRP